MSNVVGLRGDVTPGTQVTDVVAELETLLMQAKSGEIRGLAFCVTKVNSRIVTGWAGEGGTMPELLSGIGMLQHRFCAIWLGGEK